MTLVLTVVKVTTVLDISGQMELCLSDTVYLHLLLVLQLLLSCFIRLFNKISFSLQHLLMEHLLFWST